jgi:uncharacterized membrane protein YczE
MKRNDLIIATVFFIICDIVGLLLSAYNSPPTPGPYIYTISAIIMALGAIVFSLQVGFYLGTHRRKL